MGAELTPDTIPGEAGQQVVDVSVSFTKGCYTGQELVARINSRGGNVPRPVRLLTTSDGSTLSVGDPVLLDGEQVGAVTSAAGDSALAPLLRKAEVGTDVTVGNDAGSSQRAGRKLTTNSAPPRSERRATTVPPMPSVSSRTIARPSPLPDSRTFGLCWLT